MRQWRTTSRGRLIEVSHRGRFVRRVGSTVAVTSPARAKVIAQRAIGPLDSTLRSYQVTSARLVRGSSGSPLVHPRPQQPSDLPPSPFRPAANHPVVAHPANRRPDRRVRYHFRDGDPAPSAETVVRQRRIC